jgi:hypothetical protein
MITNGGRDGPALSSDNVVATLEEESGGPQDLITLVGFLDDSDRSGQPRLFVDPALTHWLHIRDADIIDRRRIPDEQNAHGGRSVLTLKRGAVLTKGELITADAEAQFLSGGDTHVLRCEPEEQTLVRRPLDDPTVTRLLTPPGAECCG